MDFANRIGYDNFVWWLGVVEDDQDPLHLGRCRVRIFGSHSPNLDLIPTDSLPWASPARPSNYSKSNDTPRLGEYVMGFFLDGLSSQFPVMLGVIPGVPQEEPRAATGFSPLAREYNAPQANNTTANTATDGTVIHQFVTTGVIVTDTGDETDRLAKRYPQPPANAPAMALSRVGEPTTPANAYTANGTIIALTNSDLVHSCDFRFLVNFGDLNIGTIENPITLIQDAIKNAKNKAAAIIKTLLSKLLDTFRVTFKGILIALNLDPTGQIGQAISQARDAIRKINAISRKIAEYVGSAALMVALVKELNQIVDWIKSLPKKVLGMLQDCLSTFTNAIKTAAAQVTAIPGQVSNGLIGAFTDLQKSAEATQQAAETAQSSANVPNTLIQIVNSPSTANNQDLTVYINTQFPNTNTIIAQTNSSSHNPNNASLP